MFGYGFFLNNKSAGARVKNHQRAFHTVVQLMWACNTNAWNGEVCFLVAVVCRLVGMEARAIPAERRGSCCFLLGIVSVTFLGASHAGITGDSSLSVVKIHPARRCDGVLSLLLYVGPGDVFSSHRLLFFGLDPIGFDSRDEI